MNYVISWMFPDDKLRFWGGVGVGYCGSKKNARTFRTHDLASREAEMIIESRGIGASVRPENDKRRFIK